MNLATHHACNCQLGQLIKEGPRNYSLIVEVCLLMDVGVCLSIQKHVEDENIAASEKPTCFIRTIKSELVLIICNFYKKLLYFLNISTKLFHLITNFKRVI